MGEPKSPRNLDGVMTRETVPVDHEARTFASRWALVAGLIVLVLVAHGIVLGKPDDPTMPADALEAMSSPGFRSLALFDGLGWAAMGVTLIALGFLIERTHRLRGRLVALFGLAQLAGSAGGFFRYVVFTDLADRYGAATPEAQRAIIEIFVAVGNVPIVLFIVGGLFQAAGFLLAASAIRQGAGASPRLAWFLALPGITAAIVTVANVGRVTDPQILMPIVVPHVLLLVVCQFAVAWFLRSARAPAATGVPAGIVE